MNPRMGRTEWLLLVLLSLLWGGAFFFTEVALRELPPFTLVLARVGFAAIALLAYVHATGDRMPASPRLWGAFLAMGLLNNFVPFSLIVWGQTQIAGGLAAILNATTPIFSVVLAHVLTNDERMTRSRVGGVLLGLCGVILLVGPNAIRGLGLQSSGQLAVLLGACSYACAAIYGRRFKMLPPAITAAGQVTTTALLMLPIAMLLERPWTLAPGPITWSAVLGIALLSTAVAYLIYFRILAAAGATNILLVTLLIPVSALLLGILVLGEPLDWTMLAGMVLIFAGLAAIDGRVLSILRATSLQHRARGRN